mgnify:CR=1 FL=1
MYKKWKIWICWREEHKKFTQKKHNSTKIREHFETDISPLVIKIRSLNFKHRAVQKIIKNGIISISKKTLEVQI